MPIFQLIYSPNMGIGDILLLKMIFFNNNIDVNLINLSENDIKRWKCQPEKYLNFISQFIKLVFPNAVVNIGDYPIHNYLRDHLHLPINEVYLYDSLSFNKKLITNYEDYIIIHTKVRLDGCGENFINNDIPIINSYFQNFKTSKKIIILGEKSLEQNAEVQIHKIVSIYPYLIQLKEKNDVIDLSKDNLCSGTEDFDSFIYDIELINKSDLNIVFGIGGPFNLSQTMSKNSICYISEFNDYYFMKFFDCYNKINNNMYRDLNMFFKKLDKIMNEL